MRIIYTFSLFFLTIFNSAFGVCFTELDAEIYGCIKIRSDESKQKECQKKFGKEFGAYYTTNTCTKELEALVRGVEYDKSKEEDFEAVEAACMSYEQGTKRGCNVYNYDMAEKYCTERFGQRYIPFILEGEKCTLEEASKSRGEEDSVKIIEGFDSDFEEIEKMMTMLDKEGMNNSLGSIIYTRPNIDTEFYVGITKRIMAKMNMAKESLYKRSHLKVSVRNPHTKKFLKYVFRYKSLLARLYKLYAFVAHQNHYVLNSYKFENLEYLDLKLRKDFGLEVLAKVNFSVVTIDEGKSLLLKVGEDERQTYEYQAIQDPLNKTEYAKLVSFMGVRENLVNLWAVQKLSEQKVSNSSVSSCGKGFLSFRPGRRGQMELSKAMVSLKEYDIFYNDYQYRWNDLIEQSKKATILNEVTAKELMYEIISKTPSLKEFLISQSQVPIENDNDLRKLAAKDANMLVDAETEAWQYFVDHHFSTIVMPGDNVLNKWDIINRIWRDSYDKRVEAISDIFIGAYVWVDDKTVNEIRQKIKEFIELKYKNDFFFRTKDNLVKALKDYNNKSILTKKYIKEKIDSVTAIAYTAAQAAYINYLLSLKRKLNVTKPITPINNEELAAFFNSKIDKEFYDVRFTMEKDNKKAEIVDKFFKRVGELYVSQTQDIINRISQEDKLNAAKILMFEKNQELSDKLREAAVIAAREFFLNYPFEITSLEPIDPSQMYILGPQAKEESQRIWDNHQRLQVDTSGNPVARPDRELSEAFESSKRKSEAEVKRIEQARKRLFGYSTGAKGYVKDKITTGEIARPLKVDDKGIITTPQGINSIQNNKLIDMYLRGGNINELAGNALRSRKREIIKYGDKDTREGKFISDNREFFYRMLESLDLAWIAYVDDRASTYYGSFIQSDSDQGIIASYRIAKAYQLEPILRNEITWKQKESHMVHNGMNFYKSTRTVEYSKPLLLKIAMSSISTNTFQIDDVRTKKLINIAIDGAIKNVPEKLSKFCKANYLNYKTDANFKDVYDSSTFIRATLKNSVGISEEQAKRFKDLDEGVRKDIRGLFESWNEDYIEPSLHILGTAALISLGVMLIIGTSGLAAPGVLGTVYSIASTFLAVEFFVSFPLVVGSLYSRVNTHFIEVPAQLKFQKSLAMSQLDKAKIVDWDLLKSAEQENKTMQAWTAGFAPFDFIYGYSLVKHVRVKSGLSAVAAYKRQTGMKLRKWSAPAASNFESTSFRELRKQHGLWKGTVQKGSQIVRRVRMHLPKYQQLSDDMIHTAPLRLGIARYAQKMKIHNQPWKILGELKEYTTKLSSRYEAYKQYVASETKMLQRYRLNGRFTFGDFRKHGISYTSLSFIPKSLILAIKTKRLKAFFTNFGDIWNELKSLQGQLIHERVSTLETVIKKLESFKANHFYGTHQRITGSKNLMDDFQRLLTDEEILALEEIANKSRGYMQGFKEVFKDHKVIIEGLKPMQYAFGHPGEHFTSSTHYPQNIIMGDKVHSSYTFNNTSEDIVNFYESLMRQNAVNSPDLNEVRRDIEEMLGRQFIFKPNGERIYFD